MDKSWMNLPRSDNRYFEGIIQFTNFVKENNNVNIHPCPCKRCLLVRGKITLDEIKIHLIKYGMMLNYTTWTSHGEVVIEPSVCILRDQYIQEMRKQQVGSTSRANPIMEFLDDMFHYRHTNEDISMDHSLINDEYEKYSKLVAEAQTPIYDGSDITILDAILHSVELKVKHRWPEKIMDDHLKIMRRSLPNGNKYPGSYAQLKKLLENMGLRYEIIHACQNGYLLYYKELEHLDICPICSDHRYLPNEENTKIPKRVVRYFPLAPILQRLFMSPKIAKEMRWHAEKVENDSDIRHPADGEAWADFNTAFPEFSREIRNVRLGLATDGFNPFGETSIPYSTWPIMVMPYNFPPSMCIKKEYNILTLLISGPKSPGKCLNVFMRPLIDELNMLWNSGVPTFDRHDGSSFCMKAVVLWTISDFPGLRMLVGMKTKGYRACPSCFDDIDAVNLAGTMCYQGHRRWLDKNHSWRRAADKFNSSTELSNAPISLSGDEVLSKIFCHKYLPISMHPDFRKSRSEPNRVCWTHMTIFYELPYWKTLKQPYSLDVMHIKTNVFNNIIGTILGLEGKTRDGPKAREGLRIQGVRQNLWQDEFGVSSSRRE